MPCTSHPSALVSSWYRRPSPPPSCAPSRTCCFFPHGALPWETEQGSTTAQRRDQWALLGPAELSLIVGTNGIPEGPIRLGSKTRSSHIARISLGASATPQNEPRFTDPITYFLGDPGPGARFKGYFTHPIRSLSHTKAKRSPVYLLAVRRHQRDGSATSRTVRLIAPNAVRSAYRVYDISYTVALLTPCRTHCVYVGPS
ncbi:hypothetical protein BJV74DRAFT_804308 [Russula compacta]|nr:hypothetical protein BJV74DRAFT_804308 [Russula compacta]